MMVLTSYNWDYFVTTAPAVEPITLAEVKAQIGISDTSDDTLLTAMITAVRTCAEKITNRTFIDTEFTTYRNGFSDFQYYQSGGECQLELRRSPYLSSAAITYTDCDDATQTLVLDTDFYVEKRTTWSRLLPIVEWPLDVRNRRQDVTIVFNAGYGASGSDVPADLRQAMLMHVAAFYANRGDCSDAACGECVDCAVMMIYNKYRIKMV